MGAGGYHSYLTVPQGDIKHTSRAAQEANPNAVKDHPLAPVTNNLRQVLWPDSMDEGCEAASHGLLCSSPLLHCGDKQKARISQAAGPDPIRPPLLPWSRTLLVKESYWFQWSCLGMTGVKVTEPTLPWF